MAKFYLKQINVLNIFLILFFSFLDVDIQAQTNELRVRNSESRKIITIDNIDLFVGDAIYIDTEPDTTSFLHGIYKIDQLGRINLPIQGFLELRKFSENSLRSWLLDRYQNELKYQTLVLRPLIRIGMIGGFANPGFYYINPRASFWELMAISGGPVERKFLRKAVIIKGDKRYKIDLFKKIKAGESLMKIGLASGDIIEIPSPGEKTKWETLRDIVAVTSIAATFLTVYFTYQRDRLILSR